MSGVGFNTDFGRAVDTERAKTRLTLQKKTSAIYELFKPKDKQKGASTHEVYLGPVEFENSLENDVWPDSPQVQHPSLATRKNKAKQSRVYVGVPRKVAQTRGLAASQLAASYVTPIEAAKSRKVETQLTELLSETFVLNPIMDGLDLQNNETEGKFLTAQNKVGVYGGTATHKLHFLDLMEARKDLAQTRGEGLTSMQMMRMDAVDTVKDINAIIFADNETWFAFITQNRNTFFNRDFSNHYSAAFETDGFKINAFQDMAVITTAQKVRSVDTFALGTDLLFDSGVGVSSGGTKVNTTGTDFRPLYILPRGGFEMKKPDADDFPLELKAIQTKSFNEAFYSECNVYGVRPYDTQVLRYWVDVNDKAAIA